MEDAEKDAPILIFWDCLFSFLSMDIGGCGTKSFDIGDEKLPVQVDG